MAQVRNISDSFRAVPDRGVEVGPGEVLTVDDDDILPENFNGDSLEGRAHMDAHPNARNWRIPGVWAVEGDPPPPGKPSKPVTEPPAEPAPTES